VAGVKLQNNMSNPEGTTISEGHDKAVEKLGLGRHTASAYLIVLKVSNNLNLP
jgi:hypothetical protein